MTFLGETYYCPVCGVEITVLHGDPAESDLCCCNQKMLKKPGKCMVFCCNNCGSELLWVHNSGVTPEPCCCNMKMVLLEGDRT